MLTKLTFDVSVLDIDSEGTIEVLATNGDTHLGGDDVDNALLEYILDEYNKEQAVDLRKDDMALQRIKDEVEKAKKELSSTTSYDINLPYITVDSTGPKNLTMTITRTKFEELISDIVERTIKPCKAVLKDAKLDIKDIDEVILVGGSTRIPLVQSKVEAFFGKKPNNSVNPDEVVALGAAIQAGIIGGDVTDVLLLDVTPLTLGIETMGGVMTTMIPRNTTIPVEKKEIFSTAVDNQPAVDIVIGQGERTLMVDNKQLGRFKLDGIAPAPRGVPQIEVSLNIDANGVLNVKAIDKATGKEQSVTIQGSTGMSEEEIDKLVKEAEAHKEEDNKKKELVEIKNNADSTVFQSEKTLADNKDKISDEDKTKLEELNKELKELISKDDFDKDIVKTKTEELSKVLMEVGQKMYSTANENNTTKTSEDDIQDAEVVDDNSEEKK